MNENNNNIPQGLITNDKIADIPQVSENAPKTKTKISFSNKGNMKIIIGVAVIIIAAVVLYTLMSGKKVNMFKNNKQKAPVEIVALDLDTSWGKEYSVAAQNVYEQQEVDKIDVTFINLDFTDEPEMIVKYIDSSKREAMVVYSIDHTTGKAKNTKTFTQASLAMLFSLEDGDVEWYLYISSGKKYGTYTRFSKIISGTVKATDEDVRTEKSLNEFNEKYIQSQYKVIYYEVNKAKFEENFKTIYGRFTEYDNTIYEEKTNLESGNSENVIKRHDEGDYIDTGKYYISYGVYDYVPITNQDESEVKTNYSDFVITVNRDGTIDLNGTPVKYDIRNEFINLENGQVIRVIDVNTIVYEVEGGIKFKAHDPFVKPEPEKKSEGEEQNPIN